MWLIVSVVFSLEECEMICFFQWLRPYCGNTARVAMAKLGSKGLRN